MARKEETNWTAKCQHKTVRLIKTDGGKPFALKCTTCPVTLSPKMIATPDGTRREILEGETNR